MDEHTYAREKSRGTYCSLVWIRTLHQTQPTSVMTQHHWSISLDNQKSTIHLSLLKCEVHKDTSLCFTHRLSDKREPNANASSRLELHVCQFSDRFWKTWSAEINKLITLSRLRIILTCDIHCNILCDEIISLEINPYIRWRTFNHFRSQVQESGMNLQWGRVYNTATPPSSVLQSTSRTGHNTEQSLLFLLFCCAERCEEEWPLWTHPWEEGNNLGWHMVDLRLSRSFVNAFCRDSGCTWLQWLLFPFTRDTHSRHMGLGSDQALALLCVVTWHINTSWN